MKELTSCLCCGSDTLRPYFNLGQQPPCNELLNSTEFKQAHVFPLEIQICQRCWHSQLKYAVNPEILFADYPYRTGVSETLRKHYYDLSQSVRGPDIQHVLDIGCNDGTLMSFYKDQGCITYGVDPYDVPERQGVDFFINDHWWEHIFMGRQFDLITATNVLAHNDYPERFLRLIAARLSARGKVVLEFPYAMELILQRQFDTIYHEHVSYFTAHSLRQLIRGTGLYVIEADEFGIHGGSLRIVLKPCQTGDEVELSVPLKRFIQHEEVAKLNQVETYTEFGLSVDRVCFSIAELLRQDRQEGRTLIGFGASAKSSVFLNYTNIPVEYLVDETPSKIGKYSPGKLVPIRSLEQLTNENRPLGIIIFSWNCLEESLYKIRKARGDKISQDVYYVYVPYFQRLNFINRT